MITFKYELAGNILKFCKNKTLFRALSIEMCEVSCGLSPKFITKMITKLDIPHHTRLFCQVDGNIKYQRFYKKIELPM